MKLRDLPRHGYLPRPERREPRDPRPTTDPCPECGKGRVIHLSDDPRDVRWTCTRCGWSA